MARMTIAQHRASARKAAERSSRARIAARNRAHDRGADANPELIAAATARLDPYYGLAIVEDDPYARDGYFGFDAIDDGPPVDCPMRSPHREPRPCTLANGHDGPCQWPRKAAPRRTAPAPAPRIVRSVSVADIMPRATLDPCPRCGRIDWRANGVGRQWHLDNYPGCGQAPRHPAHKYREVSA